MDEYFFGLRHPGKRCWLNKAHVGCFYPEHRIPGIQPKTANLFADSVPADFLCTGVCAAWICLIHYLHITKRRLLRMGVATLIKDLSLDILDGCNRKFGKHLAFLYGNDMFSLYGINSQKSFVSRA